MKLSRRIIVAFALSALMAATLAGCSSDMNANQAGANANATPAAAQTPAGLTLSVVDAPEMVRTMMAGRGEQDRATPTLRIVEPADGSTVNGSTVRVRLTLSGDLKGYKPGKDPQTGMGNHVHVILDNQPYEAYYNLDQPFELRNVSPGEHTLRVFPSRPWHESYKNEGAFQMVRFTVSGGGQQQGASANVTTNNANTNANQSAANVNASGNANANASATPGGAPAAEGKDMQPSTAGDVDRNKPLLTYSRPKGEYKGAEADPIMIDFWLTNAKLQGDGGEYRVRLTLDGGQPHYIDRWAPVWFQGWTAGKHSVRLELVDRNGNVVENGGYNSTTRDITVAK